jgi:hypothetical protein
MSIVPVPGTARRSASAWAANLARSAGRARHGYWTGPCMAHIISSTTNPKYIIPYPFPRSHPTQYSLSRRHPAACPALPVLLHRPPQAAPPPFHLRTPALLATTQLRRRCIPPARRVRCAARRAAPVSSSSTPHYRPPRLRSGRRASPLRPPPPCTTRPRRPSPPQLAVAPPFASVGASVAMGQRLAASSGSRGASGRHATGSRAYRRRICCVMDS